MNQLTEPPAKPSPLRVVDQLHDVAIKRDRIAFAYLHGSEATSTENTTKLAQINYAGSSGVAAKELTDRRFDMRDKRLGKPIPRRHLCIESSQVPAPVRTLLNNLR